MPDKWRCAAMAMRSVSPSRMASARTPKWRGVSASAARLDARVMGDARQSRHPGGGEVLGELGVGHVCDLR